MKFIAASAVLAMALLDSSSVVQAVNWKRGKNRIYDSDGDGVEDNVDKTSSELDEYYDPAVYGWVEDLQNTHHGNMPGHIQREFDIAESEPKYHNADLVQRDWVRW